MIDGICKYPNMELARMYREKAYEEELKKVGLLPENGTKKIIYNNKKSSRMVSPLPPSKHQHHLSTPSKIPVLSNLKDIHRPSQLPSHRDSWSASYTTSSTARNTSKYTMDIPPVFSETGLSYSSLDDQDMYTINEKQFSQLNLADKEYTGYEFEHLTDILEKKDKLLPPISSIPESVIKNSEALKVKLLILNKLFIK